MEICRACLFPEHNMFPLDETFVNNYNLLTNLNVTLQDGMPQSLCVHCAEVVRSFIEFREKSILSETTLWRELQDKNLQVETRDEKKLCIKQEVKTEKIDDEHFDEFIDYQEENEKQFSITTKKEPAIKQRKCKKTYKTQSKKNNKKNKVKVNQNNRGVKTKKKVTATDAGQILPCGICKNKFEDDNNLKSHLQMHMKYKECDICHEQFSAWPGLLSHRLEHIPDRQGHCHICNKRYVSSVYLEHHYLTVHNDGQQMLLKCKICLHTFKTPKKLKSHMLVTHGEARFFCDHCSKGFTCKSALRSHIKSHSDHKSEVCDLCDFQCHLKQSLKLHKLRKHTPNKVTCKACEIIFTNQEKYDSHKCKAIEVTCTHCGKMVSSKTMSRHMRSHHEGAQFACARCPAAFKTRGALRVHADRHDGVRRLQCDYCPAKFFSHPVLIKHRRIHTGEKPYVCKICSKAFTGNNNLKVHMKVHGIFTVIKKDSVAENIGDIFKENRAC